MPPRKRGGLTAVPDDPAPTPPPAPKRPATVADAADSGTRRDLLVAQRRRLARAVDSPETRPRELAQLSRQLLVIDDEIRQIDALSADESEDAGEVLLTDEPWDASAI